MEYLSNSHLRGTTKLSEIEAENFTYEGRPVSVVVVFSDRGKRIAIVEDEDGNQFDVLMDQLSSQ